ncbi:hypothetical protein JQ621_04315 [Bradyrhizobium manausense]|uniref:hypothetical protein n=1 Tax=Bradyrhizobium manausense TaxID=989370 RepID=UPI001BA90846|nr:hypothetical protein [Bradyrhizobium manausense]MBR1086695.1 hypothetical protein [Bradyrhizobium manausense]
MVFVSEAFTIAVTLPIFLICCFNVARIGEDRATVQDMIWLCIYMFLVISTCQSLFNGYFESEGLMEGVRFETADILKATLIVVVFLLVATATSIWVGNVGVKTLTSYELRDSSFVVLLLGNIASFGLFIVSVGGLANALADRLSKEEFYAPVATGFLAAQLVTCFLGAAYVRARPFRFWTAAGFALMVLLQLVSQNPFNTARFFLLIAWLPIILIYLKGRFSVTFFYMSALFGLIVMMPLLNFTGRHGETVKQALENVELPKFLFKIPYIDLLNLMVYAVQELEHIPYYYGAKTLSLLLFLVPRDIWPGKEILLGIELGNRLVDAGLAGTENLSMFFAADFYADLGMAGVILGAFVVSLLLTLYGQNRVVLIDGMDLPGFALMACAPILIRGPIGAVIALPFLVLVALWVARVVLCTRVATDAHMKSAT